MKSSDTKELLLKSNEGSKMAVGSIDHTVKLVRNKELRGVLQEYRRDHVKLGEQLHEMLTKRGVADREPGRGKKLMANVMTRMKLLQGPVDSQAAKLMMDGCNMGIQSLAEYLNRYPNADAECRSVAKEMIACEYRMMRRMERYL